jgi:hypothetical protein
MSEGIGKQIAKQLAGHLTERELRMQNSVEAEDSVQHCLGSLKKALVIAIKDFNEDVPSRSKLNLIDQLDGWQLKFNTNLMVTIKLAGGKIHVVPTKSNIENPTTATFDFNWGQESPVYKGVSSNPGFQTPILSQDEFIGGLLREACGKHFDAAL